jgi:hypothetical protein
MKKKTQEPTVSQEPTVEIVNLGLGYSFDRFFCPACGAAILQSGEPFEPECPHVEWAIFEGEFEYMNLPAAVEAQLEELEEKRQEDGDDFDRFDELLKIWRGNKRMVFNITSEGMACGPVSETLSVGLNFVPDENAEMGTETPSEPGEMIEEDFSEVLEAHDIVKVGIPRMTFAEFCATRKPCDASEMEALSDQFFTAGAPCSSGYVYIDLLGIEIIGESSPNCTGTYYHEIASDCQSNDLAKLEQILYRYAIEEHYIKPRGEHE